MYYILQGVVYHLSDLGPSLPTTGKQTPPDEDLGQMDIRPSRICESDPSAAYWHRLY